MQRLESRLSKKDWFAVSVKVYGVYESKSMAGEGGNERPDPVKWQQTKVCSIRISLTSKLLQDCMARRKRLIH